MYLVGAFIIGVAFLAFGVATAVYKSNPAARRLLLASIVYHPVLLALIALDAKLRSLGPGEEDESLLPVAEFFRAPRHDGQRENVLLPNQLVTHILLVRHGETEWNLVERFRGQADVPLNETGLAQAEATGRRVGATWQVAAVYSSPLSRAVKTAEAIAARAGVDTDGVYRTLKKMARKGLVRIKRGKSVLLFGLMPFAVGFLFFSFLSVCPGFYFRQHYFILFLPAVALFAGVGAYFASLPARCSGPGGVDDGQQPQPGAVHVHHPDRAAGADGRLRRSWSDAYSALYGWFGPWPGGPALWRAPGAGLVGGGDAAGCGRACG